MRILWEQHYAGERRMVQHSEADNAATTVQLHRSSNLSCQVHDGQRPTQQASTGNLYASRNESFNRPLLARWRSRENLSDWMSWLKGRPLQPLRLYSGLWPGVVEIDEEGSAEPWSREHYWDQ